MNYTITGDAATVAGFKVGKYIRMIRNEVKKEYAHRYFQWTLKGRIGDAPKEGRLSYMAQQAVRMQIDALLNQRDENDTWNQVKFLAE